MCFGRVCNFSKIKKLFATRARDSHAPAGPTPPYRHAALQQKPLRCAALALTFWLGSLGNLGRTHSAGADARAHCANARLAAQHYYNKEQNANKLEPVSVRLRGFGLGKVWVIVLARLPIVFRSVAKGMRGRLAI